MLKNSILFLILWLPVAASAQYWEAGIFLGGSNYSGDLTQKPMYFKETHPAIGALIRYNPNRRWAIKGNIYYGMISGSDENSTAANRRTRNLSFRSPVLEFGLDAEYNLKEYETGTRYEFAPYLFLGIGVFRFNPQALFTGEAGGNNYNNAWIPLQPLGTEGQETTQYQDRKKYSLTQMSIPFGIGFKQSISFHMNIGFEIGARKTFTDYLDDVSKTFVQEDIIRAASGDLAAKLSNRTGEVGPHIPLGPGTDRGNSMTKDWYYFAGFTISYSFFPEHCPHF